MDPPAGLLQHVQTVLVNFLWNNLHWVPQSLLYLPKEEVACAEYVERESIVQILCPSLEQEKVEWEKGHCEERD